ncbi:MAG: NAD(P)-dependent oxidoreductase, partial [Dialister sp.]|nr:NAD(P)-dependent oxidoreductase [Dialister sp.]
SKEPLPGDHPFWQMDNVIMTPHIASMVPDFWDKLTSLLQMNFVAFARGDKLMNEVDKKKGY